MGVAAFVVVEHEPAILHHGQILIAVGIPVGNFAPFRFSRRFVCP